MKLEKEFIEGFLVLGFAIFILGFLAGMLAIALVSLKMDSAILFVVFSVGLLVGILMVALTLLILRLKG